MNRGRILAIAKKQFLILKHEPRTLVLMLLAPVMAMLVFGFAFGTEPKNLPVIIVNQDEGTLASEYVDNIDHETLELSYSTDVETSKRVINDGEAIAVFVFPKTFTDDATPKLNFENGRPSSPTIKGAHIEVYIDTTNQQLSSAVSIAIVEAGKNLAESKESTNPINIDINYAFEKAKDARYIDYFVPGIVAFAITLFTTLLTLLAFVGERVKGTLDRLKVTPVTETEIVVGYEIAFGAIATLQGMIIIIVAIVIYDILIVGSVFLAMLIVILVAIDAQAIGILISSSAKSESQAVQLLPFIIFPIYLLSGIFVAVESLPSWLQPLAYLLPPTWGIEALRAVMLKGWGIDQLWLHVLVLAAFAVIFTLLAIVGLKRSRNQ